MNSERPSVIPGPNGEEAQERRSIPPDEKSRRVQDLFKKAVEKGIEAGVSTFANTNEAIKGAIGEGKLPREVMNAIFGSIDETKNALVRVVAREVRDFLEATDVASELQRALTSLSFEVKTEIRFIPNDAGGLKPNVKAQVAKKKVERTEENKEDISSEA